MYIKSLYHSFYIMETATVSEENTQIGVESNEANITAIIESTIVTCKPLPEPIPEPSYEPASELTKTIQSATVSMLMRIVVTSELASLSVPLDKTTSAILLELLDKTPKTFDNAQDLVQSIVQDGKLNATDLPHLHKLVMELYPLVKQSKYRPSSLECAKIVGLIVKVIIHVLVNEHKIKVSNPTQFLKDVDGLVDSAIDLLSLAKNVKLQTSKCSKLFRI